MAEIKASYPKDIRLEIEELRILIDILTGELEYIVLEDNNE